MKVEAERRAAAAEANPPRRGRGPISALVTHIDREGKREEVVAGRHGSDVVRTMAAQPIRPGTITRIGYPPAYEGKEDRNMVVGGGVEGLPTPARGGKGIGAIPALGGGSVLGSHALHGSGIIDVGVGVHGDDAW